MKQTVRVGVFEQMANARQAVANLVEAGFSKDEISVICPTCTEPVDREIEHREKSGAHTVEGLTAGGTVGAILGGLAAIIGAATTGGTALLAAGPLLAGSAGGAVGGGFIGAMLTRGFEPAISDYYDQALENGMILVAVEDETNDAQRLTRAEKALRDAGAEPVKLNAG